MDTRNRKPHRRDTSPTGGKAPRRARATGAIRLLSLGHSNHALDKVLDLLRRYSIETLVDVRSFPRSRYAPHFDADSLSSALAQAGITYRYLGKALGGRPPRKEFYDQRGRVVYDRVADSPPFLCGIERLRWLTERSRVAVLCSEEDPTACHRRLLLGPVVAATGLVLGHIRANGRVQTEVHLGGWDALDDASRDFVQLRLL